MLTFNVVKEQHGWAIRMGERMTTPFWTRDAAVREAHCLAEAIRCHGECIDVVVEGDPKEVPERNRGDFGVRGNSASRSLDGPW